MCYRYIMAKIKFLKALLLGIFALPLFAQTGEMVISEPLSTKHEYLIVGGFKDTSYLLIEQNDKYEIHVFDAKLKFVEKRQVEISQKDVTMLGVVIDRNKFSFLYEFEKSGKTIVAGIRFDEQARQDTSFLIKAFDRSVNIPAKGLVVSDDNRQLAIFGIHNQSEFELVSYDLEQIKLNYSEKVQSTRDEMYTDYLELIASNAGEVYFVSTENNYKPKHGDNKFNFMRFSVGGSTRYSVSMAGQLWNEVKFAYDNKNHKLVAAGYFAFKNTDFANGFFFMNINKDNGEVTGKAMHPFSEQYLAKATGKNPKRMAKRGMPDIHVRNLVLRNDGGALLISEVERILQRRIYNQSPVYYGYSMVYPVGYGSYDYQAEYTYSDMYATSFHPDGKIHWQEIMRKSHNSVNDGGIYGSFFMMKSKDALQFLYNDISSRDEQISAFILNGKGEVQRVNYFNASEKKVELTLRRAIKISNSELLVLSEGRRELRLVKLVLGK